MRPQGTMHSSSILIVDDDASLAGTLQELLQQEGYAVEVAFSAPEAIVLQERNPSLSIALVDLIMPVTDGLELMDQLHQRNPDLTVIIMTGYGTIESAVEAMKRGAEDYLTKPFDYDVVRKKVARLTEVLELREQVAQLEANLAGSPSFENFLYISPPMQRTVDRARAAAATPAAVLLVGETGTGKEMLARAIHEASPRARNPFLPVNCAALPRELVESELFGARRGAFTGAHVTTPGIFLAATGGTVFLDEVSEMPKEIQVKLLRALQEGEVRPVGSPKPLRVDVRIISATNRPLPELRATFLREDLYFRIATILIEIPPLRGRWEDVLMLAQHFTARLARRYERQITLAPSAIQLLLNYSFPGNVRELANILESAVAVSQENPQTITDRDLRSLLQEAQYAAAPASTTEQALSMEQMEHLAIQQALRLCRGNRTKAASLLGISRDTLYRKLRHFNGQT